MLPLRHTILATGFTASLSTFAHAEINFNYDVRPILSKNCIGCHGPDPEGRGGDYRLDTREGALRTKDGVSGIIPGDAENSDVYKRIISDDPKYRMPEASHGDPLKPEQIAVIKQWIDEGAVYEAHWSFVPPELPEPPETGIDDRVRNPIDSFVFAKLESKGLTPSPEAEPHEVLRRVALDLTGLPPTLEQLDAFEADPSDEHYSRLVDGFLASPAFGEHWAAKWLDYSRYADTIGYAEDTHRDVWPWRDWVIRAYNDNMPFDQFTREQIAGDLIPNATEDQILATAFHRNTPSNSEGGTSDEEFRTIAVKDRVGVTVNTWMGLTMRCAECHTHKYDPITHKEYYQFLDYFNQTEDYDAKDDRPHHSFYPEGRGSEFRKLDERIAELREKREAEPSPWDFLSPSTASSSGGSELEILDDGSVLATGENPKHDDYTITVTVPAGSHRGLRLETLPDESSNNNVGRSNEGAFIMSQVQVLRGEQELSLTAATDDFHQANYGATHLLQKKINAKKGWGVNHPQLGYTAKREAIFDFAEPLSVQEPTEITVIVRHRGEWAGMNAARVRLSLTEEESPVAKHRKKQLDPIGRELSSLVAKRNGPVRVPVIAERDENRRRETHINIRGNYLTHGEKVSAAVLETFHPFPEGAPQNRLGVAEWLVHEDNPLTARVTANRLWAQIFGIGIVETEEDFGSQGTLPTHPDLLDWLAVDFQSNGWDRKRFLKQIVTSTTYRQTGKATPESLEKDPRNQFLSRGPRFRLYAEVVRDQALAVSGLLSSKLYGPPVYPPNPIKRYVNAFTGGMVWNVSEGEDRYRRAVYTYLKRSQPHPLFETFDMATREVCNLRRFRTNTPLQSFQTLNDEAFVEAAQALAKLMIENGDSLEEQISYGLRRALLRPVDERKVAVLTELYNETLPQYANARADAAKFAGYAEDASISDTDLAHHAALTVVGNVILNLDGFLTK